MPSLKLHHGNFSSFQMKHMAQPQTFASSVKTSTNNLKLWNTKLPKQVNVFQLYNFPKCRSWIRLLNSMNQNQLVMGLLLTFLKMKMKIVRFNRVLYMVELNVWMRWRMINNLQLEDKCHGRYHICQIHTPKEKLIFVSLAPTDTKQ